MDAEWDDPDDRWGDELDYQEEIAPDALDQADRALLSDWEMESVAYAARVAEGYDFEAEEAAYEAEGETHVGECTASVCTCAGFAPRFPTTDPTLDGASPGEKLLGECTASACTCAGFAPQCATTDPAFAICGTVGSLEGPTPVAASRRYCAQGRLRGQRLRGQRLALRFARTRRGWGPGRFLNGRGS